MKAAGPARDSVRARTLCRLFGVLLGRQRFQRRLLDAHLEVGRDGLGLFLVVVAELVFVFFFLFELVPQHALAGVRAHAAASGAADGRNDGRLPIAAARCVSRMMTCTACSLAAVTNTAYWLPRSSRRIRSCSSFGSMRPISCPVRIGDDQLVAVSLELQLIAGAELGGRLGAPHVGQLRNGRLAALLDEQARIDRRRGRRGRALGRRACPVAADSWQRCPFSGSSLTAWAYASRASA